MEIVLPGKVLWKFVVERTAKPGDPRAESLSPEYNNADQGVDEELGDKEEKQKDLALAYILTSVGSSCKAMIRQTSCPRVAWNTINKAFKSVGEVAIDAKLTQLQV